jgi:Ternary complex associated domain 9
MENRVRLNERTRVVFSGTVSPSIFSGITRRFSPVHVSASDLARPVFLDARAVLVSFNPEKRDELAKILAAFGNQILDCGAFLGVILPDAKTEEADRATVSSITSGINKRIKTLAGWDPQEIADECSAHRSTRAPNPSLDINCPKDSPLTSSFETLLQRAFSEFKSIRLDPLYGGKSKASGVCRVDAYDKNDQRVAPFVVKTGPRSKIAPEIYGLEDLVLDRVPFQFRPPLARDRCVDGADDRLLVSMFVDRAMRFDEYLNFGPPVLAISSLFDGPLRTWRRQQDLVQRGQLLGLAEEYLRYEVIPSREDADRLLAPYLAVSIGSEIWQPRDLLGKLYGFDAVQVAQCYCHGDLHTRNIFVRHNSLDVVLIDFAHAHYQSPAARDPAKLDVAIAFDVWDDDEATHQYLPGETLTRLYRPPLLPPARFSVNHRRADAIRQVRLEAVNDCSAAEYDVTVACYLLSFAALEPSAECKNKAQFESMRSIAYALANDIIRYRSNVGVS